MKRFIIKTLIILGTALALAKTFLPDEVQVVETLEPYGNFNFGEKLYDPAIRIISTDGICSAVVIDNNYALTAAHCVTGFFDTMDPNQVFMVYDEVGQYTNVTIRPVAANIAKDIALLKGNFNKFRYAAVDFYGRDRMQLGEPLLSCGYPSGQPYLYCADWNLTGSNDFRHTAEGIVIQKGMSGGPVYNKETGNVIGVNSAVFGSSFLVGPTVGVLSDFGIDRAY